MNRHERRRQAKLSRSAAADEPPTYLDIHCAGPHSDPPTTCDKRLGVLMPFDLEDLRIQAWKADFFVTGTSPPGVGFFACPVLCLSCAEKVLPPELVAAARKVMPAKA
jgi:hypothetical protein